MARAVLYAVQAAGEDVPLLPSYAVQDATEQAAASGSLDYSRGAVGVNLNLNDWNENTWGCAALIVLAISGCVAFVSYVIGSLSCQTG